MASEAKDVVLESPKSGDGEEEDGKEKQSLGLRAKKFLASKTAETKMGRKVISTFLGDEGVKILHTIKQAATKDVGKDRAKQIKQIIIKFALKAKVLQDSGSIKKKDVWLMAEPINTMALHLYDGLKPRPGNAGAVDIKPIVADIAHVRDLCVQLLKPHTKPSNIQKMVDTFNYLGGEKFLGLLLIDDKFEEEKHVCYQGIRKIVQPLLRARKYDDSMNQLCQFTRCNEYVVEARGEFRGSNNCLAHHQQNVEQFLAKPTLLHFLVGDGADYFPFQEAMKARCERYVRKFWLTINRYKRSKENIRVVFAEEIFKKYLKKGSDHRINLDEALITKIEAGIKSKSATLFDEAEQVTFERMTEFFEKDFKSTTTMQDYITSYRLPKYMMKELEELQKTKHKEKDKDKDGKNDKVNDEKKDDDADDIIYP